MPRRPRQAHHPPWGRRATEEFVDFSEFTAVQRALDVGCGVANTAIEVARRFGGRVTAPDISR